MREQLPVTRDRQRQLWCGQEEGRIGHQDVRHRLDQNRPLGQQHRWPGERLRYRERQRFVCGPPSHRLTMLPVAHGIAQVGDGYEQLRSLRDPPGDEVVVDVRTVRVVALLLAVVEPRILDTEVAEALRRTQSNAQGAVLIVLENDDTARVSSPSTDWRRDATNLIYGCGASRREQDHVTKFGVGVDRKAVDHGGMLILVGDAEGGSRLILRWGTPRARLPGRFEDDAVR